MTIDERILHVDLAQLKVKVAALVEATIRLERAAGVLLMDDEELDRRLTELALKRQRKPQ